MTHLRLHILFLFLALLPGTSSATPREDLASPDQAVRDQAAAEIRRTFVPIPESKWAPVMAKIKKGQALEEALALFPPDIEPMPSASSGPNEYRNFRLDDQWSLTLAAGFQDHKMAEWRLNYDPLPISVEPPAHFTGAWTIYYLNGNKCQEMAYRDGKEAGDWTRFHLNGIRQTTVTSHPENGDYDQSDYDTEGRITRRNIRTHDDPVVVTIEYDSFGETLGQLTPIAGWSNPPRYDEDTHKIMIAGRDAQREVVKRAEELSAEADKHLAEAPPEEREKRAVDAQQKRDRLVTIRRFAQDQESSLRNLELISTQEAAKKAKQDAEKADESKKKPSH